MEWKSDITALPHRVENRFSRGHKEDLFLMKSYVGSKPDRKLVLDTPEVEGEGNEIDFRFHFEIEKAWILGRGLYLESRPLKREGPFFSPTNQSKNQANIEKRIH